MATKPKRKAQAPAKAPPRRRAPAVQRPNANGAAVVHFPSLVEAVAKELAGRVSAFQAPNPLGVLGGMGESLQQADVASPERSLDGILRRLQGARDRVVGANEQMGETLRRLDGYVDVAQPYDLGAAEVRIKSEGIGSQLLDELDRLHAELDTLAARVGQLQRL